MRRFGHIAYITIAVFAFGLGIFLGQFAGSDFQEPLSAFPSQANSGAGPKFAASTDAVSRTPSSRERSLNERILHWLPTRAFACPQCGTWVPTNDNSLPILLLGFLGQGAFGIRFFLQWIASERAKSSVIPLGFWWSSLAGGLLTMVYGWTILAWPIIITQGVNCLTYGRNLALIKKAGSDNLGLRHAPC